MATRKRGKGRSTGGAPRKGRSTGGAPFTPSEIDAIQKRATRVGALCAAGGAGPRGTLDHQPFIPPALIGGEHKLPAPTEEESLGTFQKVVLTDRGPKVVPLSAPLADEKVTIDYLAFTVHESILRRVYPEAQPFSDEQFLNAWGGYLAKALLRINAKVKPFASGRFGYDVSGQLGDFGFIAAGGTSASLYVQFSGHAFASADEGFPRRLFEFLKAARSHNLTRIDFAYDDFAGETFPVRSLYKAWQDGKFTAEKSPVAPQIRLVGDWHRDDKENKGLTFYVGSRDSGKMFRGYEKGKQLGDKSSPWVRAETELHGDTFHLIPEMLIHPTSYFVMLYPVLTAVEYAGMASRVERLAREGLDTVEKVLDTIRHQYGGHLHVLRQEFIHDDRELLERLCRVPKVVPAPLRKAIDLSDALEKASHAVTSSLAHETEI